jgi:hypothetical protein
LTPPADRLRLEERRDKPDHAQHQEDPQKYNGKNGDSSDYRKESFHRSSSRSEKVEHLASDGSDVAGCRLVTRLPCTTISRSAQVAPAFRRSSWMV